MTWMRPASLRIAESPNSSPVSLNRRARTPVGRTSRVSSWRAASASSRLTVVSPPRDRDLADAGRHHLALHGSEASSASISSSS